jgi:hypothetical protein
MVNFFKKQIILLAFICYLLTIVNCLSAKNEEELEYLKYKLTSYIYNTTKTLKTADLYLESGLFCYLGNDNLIDLMETNDIDQILLDINKIRDFENDTLAKDSGMLKMCSIVYVACNKIKTFKFWNDKFINNNILTISGCSFFVDNGGDIEIQVGRKNLELEINERNFKEKKIKLNPSLIRIVNNKREALAYE